MFALHAVGTHAPICETANNLEMCLIAIAPEGNENVENIFAKNSL